MANICVFTSAATNYLPKAVILAQSIKKYHPEIDVVYALCDEPSDEVDYLRGVFDECIPGRAAGIPNYRNWTFKHSIVELSTAIKPFVFRALLSRNYDAVFYLDPDIVLFGDISELISRTLAASITLTPHQIDVETSERGVVSNEITSLRFGIYNLGYLGVSNSDEGRRFADWWSQRCYSWCYADIEQGLFTDQKWLDLAPALFDRVDIVRSPRFNVAPWNVTQRYVRGDAETGLAVNGLPLAFYHFTGFDSGAHRKMADLNSGSNPDVMRLVDWYEDAIKFAPGDPASAVNWSYGNYDDGTPIKIEHRQIYRQREDLQLHFPEPFRTDGRSLLNWFETRGRIEYPDILKSILRKAGGLF